MDRLALMPKRTDIESILLIGSGPIVIGQACEFDYSGTQACRVLRAEGYRVILVNSNPATIMTDPDFADRTYIEPLDCRDAGQDRRAGAARRRPAHPRRPDRRSTWPWRCTSRACWSEYGVELIGASAEAIPTAEDRERFKAAMTEIGLAVPPSGFAYTLDEAAKVGDEVGYPVIVRPVLHPRRRRHRHRRRRRGARRAWPRRPRRQPHLRDPHRAVDRGVEGVRARGDAGPGRQLRGRLLDRELRPDGRPHRRLHHRGPGPDPVRRRVPAHARRRLRLHPPDRRRDRRVQHPVRGQPGRRRDGRHRDEPAGVSRSSALASKATGFPIAKIAARLAVGYTLDEIPNDITRKTPASFEPTIDYVVTKIPRLGVREVPRHARRARHPHAVGGRGHGHRPHVPRVAAEGAALAGARPLGAQLRPGRGRPRRASTTTSWWRRAAIATPDRPFQLEAALRRGISVERLYEATEVDPWFLDQIACITEERAQLGRRRARGA